MNEINWNDRLSPYNHSPHFPHLFTGVVDTFPLRVLCPQHKALRGALYNPKYKQCVYKAQLGIDFLGRLILCTSPHLGLCYDGHIWARTAKPYLLPWEWWIGDGAYPKLNIIFPLILLLFYLIIDIYISQTQMLSPYRHPPHGNLTNDEEFVNMVIAHYRARVEHTNHLFERHGIFRGTFRGGIGLLSDAFYVIAHTTNIELCCHLRYPPFGPWDHAPFIG